MQKITPLRAGTPKAGAQVEPAPFLLLIKQTDREDFSGRDAVLLQAISVLWVPAIGRAQVVSDLRRENENLKVRVKACPPRWWATACP